MKEKASLQSTHFCDVSLEKYQVSAQVKWVMGIKFAFK
jgi:hypothetical protein